MANEFIARKGIISLDDAQVTGSLSVTGNISASIFTGSFVGDGSQLSGVSAGFPFTGSAEVTGSLTVTGSVSATTFLGDGSQLTGIGSPIPVTATVNTGSSPLTLTTQSIVVADSTDGDITINLPDLDAIVGTSDQKPIVVYKNDYSQNVIYVQPSGSQLVNGASQDIIVSIQLAVIYNPTSAGWVTEGTSAQSLAELELFFVPRTETGSFATTGSNQFDGNQTVTGSLTVTGGINATITGSATSASYVEYTDVANKPTLVSGSEQISFNGITDKPSLVSSSAQIVEYGIFATTGSNQFDGNQAITGSLTVTGQVVAQTLNVQQITSSIVYSSGSNIFGNDLGNTQQFTGSVSVTGSLAVAGNINLNVASSFPTVGLLNRASDSTLYLVSATTGFTLTDSSLNTMYNVTPTAHNWNISNSLKMKLDASGNLGLGVTPSAWFSGVTALQFGSAGVLWSNSDRANLASNVFIDAATNTKYIVDGFALRYAQESGQHIWLTAPSGTAGNTITFTPSMTLSAAGRLLIGKTNDEGFALDVVGTGRFSGQLTASTTVGGTSAIFQNTGAQNANGIELRGGTGGTAVNWKIEKDNTVSNAFQLTPSTANGGTTYTTPVLTIASTGAATFASSVTARDLFNLRGDTAANNSQSVITFTNLRSGTWNNAQIETETGGQVWAGNLVFRTASTGFANVLTERMRITSEGNLLVQKQAVNNTDTGIGWFVNDYFCATNNSADAGDRVILINRQNSDGELIEFRQGNVAEGDITISGTTVSYNGGHLSRYSQTELNEKIEGLLKGTVMSNLDQMAVWINPETGEPYENEQLNCMKISDVEGDKNVAGVFVNWQYDSELSTNDMNIAMTGDMIIRIAEGVVIEKGDLLISAGDGTAKPQSDDLIRSNTIAKVISNHVTCTYEDGSYCVPCVLMAC
jgi:hypothetical protein